MSSAGRQWWLGAWCWLLASTFLVVAADAAPDEPVATVVVIVPETPPPLPMQRLTDALASQLAELSVQVQLSSGPAGALPAGDPIARSRRNVLAFVWIESTPADWVVHFYEPAGASLRERRIPVTGTDAASIEEVAIVVRSASSALLERARHEAEAAPSRELPSPALQTESSSPAPPPPTRPSPEAPPLQVALAYAGGLYVAKGRWEHGATGRFAWRPARSPWTVGAAYSWLPPRQHRALGVTLHLARHPAELFVGYELPISDPSLTLRPEGAVVADPVVRETRQVSDTLDAAPDETRWSWAVSTRLRIAWSPARSWWLFASGGADFMLNRFEYVVDGPGASTVLAPLRARPRVEVGLAADFPRARVGSGP